jgi:hypothetical protein
MPSERKEVKTMFRWKGWLIAFGLCIIMIPFGLLLIEKIPFESTKKEAQSKHSLRPLSGTFEVPAGNGKNIKENIVPTGLEGIETDCIRYIVKKGGPVLVRTGDGEQNKIKVSSVLITKSNGVGTIDFIKYKTARVYVEILPGCRR